MIRGLFVLSADFGEYVTASVLSRGQPFESRFALPPRLAPYAPRQPGVTFYGAAGDLERLIAIDRPDFVVLCSGYLFAINRLFGPDALQLLVAQLRGKGVGIATTDPWLRIRALKPETRFAIHSIRQGGIDVAQTEKVLALQRRLERILEDVPHLFAVPLPGAGAQCKSVFNPAFAAPMQALEGENHRKEQGKDEWLFVLSREDFAFFAGSDPAASLAALAARIEELLAVEANHLKFVGPPALGRFLEEKFPGHARVAFLPFTRFEDFEALLRRAKVVVYWNVLSASLLYCLYYGIAPVFLGKGHQASVCEGLYEHAVEHVYRGRPPAFLELERPWTATARADALIEDLKLARWLTDIRADYARLPTPAEVMQAWRR
jgi:hypothetical protein